MTRRYDIDPEPLPEGYNPLDDYERGQYEAETVPPPSEYRPYRPGPAEHV